MRWRRTVPWVLLAGAAVAALVLASQSAEPDDSAEARVERITSDLRCPTCEGLSVADSPASTARAITEDVRRRVEEGEGDAEIKAAYVDRYGEWILLRPRSSGIGAVVWALPVGALVAGLAGLGLVFRRWRRQPSLRASEADEALVEQARTAARLPVEGGEAEGGS